MSLVTTVNARQQVMSPTEHHMSVSSSELLWFCNAGFSLQITLARH